MAHRERIGGELGGHFSGKEVDSIREGCSGKNVRGVRPNNLLLAFDGVSCRRTLKLYPDGVVEYADERGR